MSALALTQSLARSERHSSVEPKGRTENSSKRADRSPVAHQAKRRSQRLLKRVSSVDVESRTDVASEVEGPDWLTRAKQALLRLLKYTFVCMNTASIVISAYVLFIANDAPSLWIPRNSLIILGLIFGMILSVIAIRGGMKEELYLVLTYSVIIAIVFVLSILTLKPVNAYTLVISTAYAAVCFSYSLALYLKPPKGVLPVELLLEPTAVAVTSSAAPASRGQESRATTVLSRSSPSLALEARSASQVMQGREASKSRQPTQACKAWAAAAERRQLFSEKTSLRSESSSGHGT